MARQTEHGGAGRSHGRVMAKMSDLLILLALAP